LIISARIRVSFSLQCPSQARELDPKRQVRPGQGLKSFEVCYKCPELNTTLKRRIFVCGRVQELLQYRVWCDVAIGQQLLLQFTGWRKS